MVSKLISYYNFIVPRGELKIKSGRYASTIIMADSSAVTAVSTDAQLRGRLVHKVVLTGGTAYLQ